RLDHRRDAPRRGRVSVTPRPRQASDRPDTLPQTAPTGGGAVVAVGDSGIGPATARQTRWDAIAFNHLCEARRDQTAPRPDLCRRVQRAEWELLFAFCYEQAVGR